MDSLEDSLQAVIDAGRAARWPQYRLRFAALREGLLQHFSSAEHPQIHRLLEMLGAAAPEHDPEGCIATLEQLAALLRERALPPLALDAPPAMDLRGLQPPEPIARIFQALERAPGEPLRVILPHEPFPLYGLLRQRGYSCTGQPRADGGFELLIDRT